MLSETDWSGNASFGTGQVNLSLTIEADWLCKVKYMGLHWLSLSL